jgi:hypothetical protein
VVYFLFRKKKEYIQICGDCEPTIICVFPDYPRELPLEAKLGDKLNFICKGFTDKNMMEEVTLFEKDIEWQHQNYVGNFVGETSDIIQGGINVSYKLPTEKKHIGKLLYVTARYHNLQDTTWIKIGE